VNDARPPTHGSEPVMQSAGYFRDQATLCLEIVRASAARHFVKADDAERRSGGAPFHQSRSGGTIKSL
jgi:hypothetical protein